MGACTLPQRSWGVQATVDVYLISEGCPESQDGDLTPAKPGTLSMLLNPSLSNDPGL